MTRNCLSLVFLLILFAYCSIVSGYSLSRIRLFKLRRTMPVEMSGLFNLKQSINLPGLKALSLIWRHPAMLIPHFHLRNIQSLDLNKLQESGIKCIVFDKDNTLSYCYSSELHPLAVEVVKLAKRDFPQNVAILSNSAGSCDDVDLSMAKEAEEATGLEVIRHKVKKPGCLQEVIDHFQARNKEPITPAQICVVGDRLMTDVVFANVNGMKSVLVGPLSYFRDHPAAAIIRILEVKVLLPIMRWVVGRNKTKTA